MKNKIITKTIFLTLILLSATNKTFGEPLTAKEIAIKVDQRDTGDTAIMNSNLVLISRNGQKRVRHLKIFRKEFGDVTKSISFFLSPADVKNTSFLTYDWDDEKKEDDSWLYLPALRKVKRIASSDKSGSFMGSDFSYTDIEGVEVNDYTYKFINKNEIVNGFDTWVIETKAKKEIKKRIIKKTGYLKSHVWIRKDLFMPVKVKLWVKKGKRIKYITFSDIEKINNIYTAKKIQAVITKKGRKEHSSLMLLNSVSYNQNLETNMFTIQQMERGL